MDAQDNVLYLPLQGVKVKKASVYKNGKPVIFRQDKDGVTLKLQEIPTDIDYVVDVYKRQVRGSVPSKRVFGKRIFLREHYPKGG